MNRAGQSATATAVATVLPPEPEGLVLEAVADTYLRGGTFANDNYGAAPELFVKNVSDVSFDRDLLLRFDLAPLAGVAVRSAQLELFSLAEHSGATFRVGPAAGAWDEAAVTWNTAPALGTPSTDIPLGVAGAYFAADLTAAAQAALAGGALNLRGALTTMANTSNTPRVGAREGPAGQRPRLRARTAPPTYAEWAAGHAALAGAAAQPQADPDADGLANLAEAFLGTDPTVPAAAPFLWLDLSGGARAVEFDVGLTRPDAFFYLLETASAPAGPWAPALGAVYEPAAGAPAGKRRWRVTLPALDTAARLFVRLRFGES